MSSNSGEALGDKPTEQPATPQPLPPRSLPWLSPQSTTAAPQPAQPTHQLWSPSLPPQVAGVAAPAAGRTPRFGMPLGMPTPHHQQASTFGMPHHHQHASALGTGMGMVGVSGQQRPMGGGWQNGMAVPSWAPPGPQAGFPLQASCTASGATAAGPRAPAMGAGAQTSAKQSLAKTKAQAAESASFCAEVQKDLDAGAPGRRSDDDSDGEDSEGSNSGSSRRRTGDGPVEKKVEDDCDDAGVSGLDHLDDEESDAEGQRVEVPQYSRWKLGDLRARAKEVARRQKTRHLAFGDDEEDVLSSLSTANRPQLADALIKLAAFRKSNGEKQDYRHWPSVTPEKAKRGHGKGKDFAAPRKDANTLCRIMAFLGDPVMFNDWTDYNRSCNRDAQDAKEIGPKHRFIQKLARAAVNVEWRNADGNPLSIPLDHKHDNPPAPDDLLSALDDLCLETPARLLRNSLRKDDNGKDDYGPLQEVLHKWMKGIRVQQKEMREREDKSGGVGADVKPGVKDEDDATQGGQAYGDGIDDGGGGASDCEEGSSAGTGGGVGGGSSAGTRGDGGGGSTAGTGGDGGGGPSAGTGGAGAGGSSNGTVGKGGGGSGAGTVGDGGEGSSGYMDKPLKDGIHQWHFCKGNLALMLFQDALVANANGDCQLLDVVIRSGKLGSKNDTDGASAHDSSRGQNEGCAKRRRRSGQTQGGGGNGAPGLQEFAALARTMEERSSRAEERELELREHDAMLERQDADPFKEAEKAAQAAEDTRKRLEDLSPQASSSVRALLKVVLAKREKKLKDCMDELLYGGSGVESETGSGKDSCDF